jgi:hypothetical protein
MRRSEGSSEGGIGRLPELLYCTALLSTHEQARAPNIYIRYYFIRAICAHAAESFFYSPPLVYRLFLKGKNFYLTLYIFT